MARNMTARNDTGQGELYKYASRYYHNKLSENTSEDMLSIGIEAPDTQEDALEYCLTWFIDWLSADAWFNSSFILEDDSPDDFYRWHGLRYFMINYEASLQPHKTIAIDKILLPRREGKSADYLSIEHIWATGVRNEDGRNNRRKDSHERRRLGNFVLLELRLNIKMPDDFIDSKIPCYLKGIDDEPRTDLEHVIKMAEEAKKVKNELGTRQRRINYYSDFSEKLNTRLEKQYVEFAEKRWSIKKYLGYEQLSNLTEDSSDEF